MQNELKVLQDVTRKLTGAGIQYMLTGSWALTFYAEPRMTRDIDIVAAIDRTAADLIVRLFEDDYYIPQNAVARAIANETQFNVIHNHFIVKVDFIIRKDNEYRRTEFQRRRLVQLDEMEIWIVSKEDLIISKLYWASDSHSEFQLRDVKKLLKSGYDAVYLDEWTRKLGLSELLRECQNE
jgi:aminoglycoside-2''-adenylyltransferase